MKVFPLLIATSNRHKLEEIAAILRVLLPEIEFDLLCAGDFEQIAEPEENGATFEANAGIKARAYAATGFVTLADDSGLVVDALNGLAGIYSARYAADAAARIEKLLGEMAEVPAEKRTARFVCAAALCSGGECTIQRGVVEGSITFAPRGAAGFGYDPVFEVTDAGAAEGIRGKTLAELTASKKNTLSHRCRALGALADVLRGYYAEKCD